MPPTICSLCTSSASDRYHYLQGSWYCHDCYKAPPSRITPGTQVTLSNGTVIGVAHLEDIKSRKLMPGGEVVRDKGRKYFS